LKKAERHFLHFQILRNGAILSSGKISVGSKRHLFLSNSRGSMQIEHFSLPRDLNIGRIEKGLCKLSLDVNWRGVATSKGVVNEVSPASGREFELTMTTGDYAMLQFGDLVLNFKLAPDKKLATLAIKRDRAHAARPFELMFQSKNEIAPFVSGAAISLILVACFISGLILFKKPLPTTMEELGQEYALKFIHPKHLQLAPETLQNRYQENLIVPLVARYYRSLAALVLGHDHPYMGLLPQNSVTSYRQKSEDFIKKIDTSIEHQGEIEAEVESNPNWALPIIPSVHGFNYSAKLSEAMGIVEKHHRGLEMNLKYRRDTTANYRKNYQDYSPTAYRDIQANTKLQEELSKITSGMAIGPEAAMYKNAENLSRIATRRQSWLSKSKSAGLSGLAHVVVVAPEFKYAVLSNLLTPRGDRKFQNIVGSEFGVKKTEKPVYRLTGELPSELIQKVISKHQFELQLCYELALRRNQTANGDLEWSWIIDKRGKPQEINLVSASIEDREMISCIKRKMTAWTFPRPKNGSIRVRYPFRFAPAKG
jgi:hypothetical protein